MTQKRLIFLGIAVAVFVFMVVSWSHSTKNSSMQGGLSSGSNTQVDTVPVNNQQDLSIDAGVAATPDEAVNSIMKDIVRDDEVIADEIQAEKDAVTDSSTELNNLTQIYDENQF